MNNKIIPVTIGVVLVLVLCGSVLVPAIDDAKYSMGDTEVFSNADNAKAVGDYKLVDSLTLTYISATEVSNGTHTYARSDSDVNERQVLSDAFLLYVVPGENHVYYQLSTSSTRSTIVSDFSAVFENGTYTVHNNGNDYTGTYSWIATQVEPGTGDYTEMIHIASTSVYLKSINQIYTAQYDNTLGWVSVNAGVANGTNTVVYDTEAVPDTLGDTYLSIGITNGTNAVNPFATIVPKEVAYIAASSGGLVSLIGVLPLLVLVATITGIVGVVVVSKR